MYASSTHSALSSGECSERSIDGSAEATIRLSSTIMKRAVPVRARTALALFLFRANISMGIVLKNFDGCQTVRSELE